MLIVLNDAEKGHLTAESFHFPLQKRSFVCPLVEGFCTAELPKLRKWRNYSPRNKKWIEEILERASQTCEDHVPAGSRLESTRWGCLYINCLATTSNEHKDLIPKTGKIRATLHHHYHQVPGDFSQVSKCKPGRSWAKTAPSIFPATVLSTRSKVFPHMRLN